MSRLININNNHQKSNILLSTYYVCQDSEKHFVDITHTNPMGWWPLLCPF